MTFPAQAPNLPGRMSKDGFVMVGSLACPQRPWIGFLFGLPNRRGGLAALRRRFLPTVGCPSVVAGLSYLVDRSHSWYPAYLQTFVLVQGTCTPLVIRHARRTKAVNLTRSRWWFKVLTCRLAARR